MPTLRPALLWLLLATGCAGELREVGPEATLNAFSQALARGDARAAYALMGAPYRERVPFAEFEAQLRAHPEEKKALAEALTKRAARTDVSEVRLADGTELRLVREGTRYALDTPVVDFYSQATPAAALDSFLRAVERSRWDVLWALMPEADRAGLDVATLGKHLEAQLEELTRIVVLLKTSRNMPIEIVGDRATMPYGESFTVRFVRENERWKIEDPE